MENSPGSIDKGGSLRLLTSVFACLVWGLLFLIPLIGLIFLFLWSRKGSGSRPGD